MSPRSALDTIDYAPTREQVLDKEQQAAAAHQEYVRRSLSNLASWMLRQYCAPLAAKGYAVSTEYNNIVGGVHRLRLKTPKAAKVFLLCYPPTNENLSLRIDFVVNEVVEGSWKISPGLRRGNPLVVEYIEPIPGTDNERITPLSTGRRLNLDGLTDRIFTDPPIDEHILRIVQRWFNTH